jgi:RNA polymerase sigma-70 factor (ECF subfamily)
MQGADRAIVTLPERFEAFYQREFKSVVGLAYALSGSRWAAEDLAQEAFIAAHRKWDRIGDYDSPGAWVRRVVANMAVSLYRKRASEARAVARVAMRRQEVLPALDPQDDDFWAEVRALPKRQAQAIALHYLEDRPVAEVADILDCSPSTAKVHLHKGRIRLADRLGIVNGDGS